MLPLRQNVLKSLAKSILIPLWLTPAAPATNAAIHKKMFGSDTRSSGLAKRTTIIISNGKINDIMKTVSSLKEFGLLIKSDEETIRNEAKEKRMISWNFIRHIRC